MRRRISVIAVGVATLVAIASPAGATSTDRGWTQNNNNYPASTTNPACSTCDAHTAYPAAYYFYQPTSFMHTDLINAASRWNNTASAWSPLLTEHIIADYTVGVWVSAASMSSSTCGYTSLYGQPSTHPSGTASWNNWRITGAKLNLNTNLRYNDTGSFTTGVCEVRQVWLHELGHALGLGHTKNTSQVMRTSNAAIYYPQSGDVHGLQCFYDSNTTACSANP